MGAEIMASKKLALLVVALVAGTSVPVHSQGGGGGGIQSPTYTQPNNAPFQNPIGIGQGQGVAPAASNINRNNTQSPTTSAPAGSLNGIKR
jgi:hypothetical protein